MSVSVFKPLIGTNFNDEVFTPHPHVKNSAHQAIHLGSILLFIFVLFAPMLLSAQQTTYSFTGKPFTSATGVFTTSDYISGFFIVNNPLVSTTLGTLFTPLSYSFTAGPLTLTNNNSTPFFTMQTSATGQIEQWYIELTVPSSSNSIRTLSYTTGYTENLTYYQPPNSSVSLGLYQSFNGSIPGTWVITTIEVPEPTSALILASGTALTAFLRKRMNKQRS